MFIKCVLQMRLIIIFIISAFIWPAYKAVQTYGKYAIRIMLFFLLGSLVVYLTGK